MFFGVNRQSEVGSHDNKIGFAVAVEIKQRFGLNIRP